MVIAVLAPEFMILWAMRQRKSARAIGDRFKQYGWGATHGYFVIMGGFALYDGNEFRGYLWETDRSNGKKSRPYDGYAERDWENIKTYHEKHRNCLEGDARHKDNTASQTSSTSLLEFLVAKEYITITEDEIKDRSHGDFISKSIAVIQTTWFILHVIARAVKGFAMTELEIITVGFAILNFITYALWWNKPLRVGQPLRVHWRKGGITKDKTLSPAATHPRN
ncbi:hypothetical protein VNI00_009560 [Paramarasmius palmivorus]|uniref:Uncharacterized protein n=1 Tax=Paramarasmius palmivorus TaxID=297713 RepID=A0AAW0CR67_9AGAR